LNYGRDQIVRFLAEAGPLSCVLDLGAGSGDDLLAARSFSPSCRLVAVESLPPAQRTLRSLGVRVIDRNLEKDILPLGGGSVDAVILNQVLEHTKEVFWILHEASRVLKVGGSLLVGVPNLASLHNRFLLALGRQPTSIQTLSAHVRGYTKDDFQKFVEGVFPGGYRLAGFGGSNFYPFPGFLARPLAAVFPGMAWGLFFRFVKERPYQGECLHYLETHPLETDFYRGPKKTRRSGGKR
jgi:SAM-dependent methyltransferase